MCNTCSAGKHTLNAPEGEASETDKVLFICISLFEKNDPPISMNSCYTIDPTIIHTENTLVTKMRLFSITPFVNRVHEATAA